MARIDRARLDGGEFPVVLEIPTRFDDLDMQGHVNNAAAVVLFQEARAGFNRAAGLRGRIDGLRLMVAGLTVEFAAEIHHPEPVEMSTGLIALGRTSITLGQVARQNGRSVAYAEVTMVIADQNGPAPIPPDLREAYERLTIKPRTSLS